jgi:hypothetical protein
MQVSKSFIIIGMLYASCALAGPADYVHTPIVEQGEKEIDFRFGTAKEPDGTHAKVTSLGFGYGVNDTWFTEIYLNREHEGADGVTLAEWENKFQLTETGKYAVDMALLTEIEAPLNNGKEPWEFKVGPLLQTEYGKWQLNGNVLFARKFGPNDNDEIRFTEISYQWQVKYRMQPAFEFGAQGFGEMGNWNDWSPVSAQNHRLGPAIFGKFRVGSKQAFKYNTAWLFGLSDAAPNSTFRMQLEYEF